MGNRCTSGIQDSAPHLARQHRHRILLWYCRHLRSLPKLTRPLPLGTHYNFDSNSTWICWLRHPLPTTSPALHPSSTSTLHPLLTHPKGKYTSPTAGQTVPCKNGRNSFPRKFLLPSTLPQPVSLHTVPCTTKTLPTRPQCTIFSSNPQQPKAVRIRSLDVGK